MNLQNWFQKYNISQDAQTELREIFAPTPVRGAGRSSEAGAQREIRIAAGAAGAVLLRNNTGVAREDDGRGGVRYIRYGLGNDSAAMNAAIKFPDLIGLTPVTFQGRVFGVFTGIEVKKPGWKYRPGGARDEPQLKALNFIKTNGGFAGFATNERDFKEIIRI